MIISASRRTDIPALYSPWFMQRLREGFALVRNPYNPSHISKITLTPDVVDCLVLWTKNPAPMLPLVEEIEAMGYMFYFQYTITAYGPDWEPGLPPREERLDTFRRLAERLGPLRVIWRYDPIIFNAEYPVFRHREIFQELAQRLEGHTKRCVFSFVDVYRKNRRRLHDIMDPSGTAESRRALATYLACVADQHGMELSACSEDTDFHVCGVKRAACIDKSLVERLIGLPLRGGKDTNQRKNCGCMESVDIGAYDSCTHRCRYCYATTGFEKVESLVRRHDPASPLLLGWPEPLAKISERPAGSARMRQLRPA